MREYVFVVAVVVVVVAVVVVVFLFLRYNLNRHTQNRVRDFACATVFLLITECTHYFAVAPLSNQAPERRL